MDINKNKYLMSIMPPINNHLQITKQENAINQPQCLWTSSSKLQLCQKTIQLKHDGSFYPSANPYTSNIFLVSASSLFLWCVKLQTHNKMCYLWQKDGI
ncbi:hypothetical protein B0189_06830 [Moraxella cuniculi]|nr:hypothetical protein B0189_06830 [Moraxella cuniculi]